MAPLAKLLLIPPTARNWPFAHVAEYKSRVVPELLLVQCCPSGDVSTVPFSPTAIRVAPVQITDFRPLAVPALTLDQYIPSGDVIIVPESPTATIEEPVQATECK